MKKDLLKEFDKKFGEFGIAGIVNSVKIKQFISKAISQTRKETLEEVDKEIGQYRYEKCNEFSTPILSDVLQLIKSLKK
jgi:hypothetical protein